MCVCVCGSAYFKFMRCTFFGSVCGVCPKYSHGGIEEKKKGKSLCSYWLLDVVSIQSYKLVSSATYAFSLKCKLPSR